MEHFLDTVETIEEGLGFSFYTLPHLFWLVVLVVTCVMVSKIYKESNDKNREKIRKIIAWMIVGNELFKMICLWIGGNYIWDYLPLHLCSLNIFLILYHSYHPENKTVGNFLYLAGIPGAMAALLFPSWATLPVVNFMYLHSFTVHIELVLYPVVLLANKEIIPELKEVPKCLGLLCILAIPAIWANTYLGTNFMFLREASAGSPLLIFQELFGSHLIGFPVIILGLIIVLYVPLEVIRKIAK